MNKRDARYQFNLIGLFAMMISGCSMNSKHDPNLTAVEPSQFKAQLSCVQEWRNLLEEWERDTHGAGKNLVEVRSSIALDKETRFASFVKDVWSHQDLGEENEMGNWPVSEVVKSNVQSALLAAEREVVPAECVGTATVLLPQLLGEEVVSERSSSPLRKIEVDAVDTTRSDGTRIGQWLFYWLLAR